MAFDRHHEYDFKSLLDDLGHSNCSYIIHVSVRSKVLQILPSPRPYTQFKMSVRLAHNPILMVFIDRVIFGSRVNHQVTLSGQHGATNRSEERNGANLWLGSGGDEFRIAITVNRME